MTKAYLLSCCSGCANSPKNFKETPCNVCKKRISEERPKEYKTFIEAERNCPYRIDSAGNKHGHEIEVRYNAKTEKEYFVVVPVQVNYETKGE